MALIQLFLEIEFSKLSTVAPTSHSSEYNHQRGSKSFPGKKKVEQTAAFSHPSLGNPSFEAFFFTLRVNRVSGGSKS
jgi:hypothetical protein